MANWKPLTAENIERAQRIFVSQGFDYTVVRGRKYLFERHGIDCGQYSSEAVSAVRRGEEFELIFNVLGSYRCRMYVYPGTDLQTMEKFPEAEYMLGITHMNHIDGIKLEFGKRYSRTERELLKQVEQRFSRIERVLLAERFPAFEF